LKHQYIDVQFCSPKVTAVPITTPSHSTIMTGRYPLAHGVRDNGLFVLGDEQQTLAEILHDQGYATAAAVGAFPLTKQFGLDQGFDLYDDHLTGLEEDFTGHRAVAKDRLFFDERRAAQVNEAIIPWLDQRGSDPFFLWVHYFDAHQPFEPPPPYDQLYADNLYDGEIAYADSRLGFLLDHMRSLGLLDHTLIVMAADHGEGLSEHNEITHAMLAYNSTLHVPLIMRAPPGSEPAGRVIETRVGTVDILPTVLDALGIPIPTQVQGRSLLSTWRNGDGYSAPPLYAENLSPRLSHGWGELRALIDGDLKYLHGPRPELFDLAVDPGEMHNLIDERPEDATRMRAELSQFMAEHAVAGASKANDLDDADRARLEALGYLHSSTADATEIVEKLLDDGTPPQDRVGLLNDLSGAKHLLFKGRANDALPYTRRLIAASPDSPTFLELHVSALAGAGRLDEAWQAAEHLRESGAISEPLLLQLVSKQYAAGEKTAALTLLEQRLADAPSARTEWLMAKFKRQANDAEGALEHLRKAVELDAGLAPARVDLAINLAESGASEEAESEFLRALKDGPYSPEAWFNYGTFALKDDRFDEATRSFQRAIELDPRYLRPHLALVVSQIASDHRGEAQDAFAALDKLAPDSAEAKTARELLDTL